jgi:hypothetical protein
MHKQMQQQGALTKRDRSRPRCATDEPEPFIGAAVAPDNPPSLATIVARTVPTTRLDLRARLLRRLLLPIGPLALSVLAGGAFAKYVQYARRARLSVSLEDAARVTSNQIVELVRYVEQSNPAVLEQMMVMLSRDTTTMAALGASVTALTVKLTPRRKLARGSTQG